jgi:hypothetical protein
MCSPCVGPIRLVEFFRSKKIPLYARSDVFVLAKVNNSEVVTTDVYYIAIYDIFNSISSACIDYSCSALS